MRIELLWFQGCPNHLKAELLLRDVMRECGVDAAVTRIEVPDEATGNRVCFPGSPTIRIDGRDVEPANNPCTCEDCTPRCRIYLTDRDMAGIPTRAWIKTAVCGE